MFALVLPRFLSISTSLAYSDTGGSVVAFAAIGAQGDARAKGARKGNSEARGSLYE